jgi:hypothetical protein
MVVIGGNKYEVIRKANLAKRERTEHTPFVPSIKPHICSHSLGRKIVDTYLKREESDETDIKPKSSKGAQNCHGCHQKQIKLRIALHL